MMILNENNQIVNLDKDPVHRATMYSVLRFKDAKNPDFYFEKIGSQIDIFNSPSISLEIGPFQIIVPFHWSILCSDMEYVQTIPIYDLKGRNFSVFCMNPIDGFVPHYLKIREGQVYTDCTWSCPVLDEKDMLVIPLGTMDRPHEGVEKGPICAMFTSHRIDVNRPISDIW